MQFTNAQAVSILQELEKASHAVLDALKIPRIPEGKTRPWKVAGGPVGVAYHYTGGPNGIKSLHWFNDPSYGNKGSSAHVLIFDRPVKQIGEIWVKYEISKLFRVPTIICGNIALGAWTTNWANSRCLGVENRNCGRAKYDENVIGKEPQIYKGVAYEPYTREQIEANIYLAKLFSSLRGSNFDPFWLVGHSQIWSVKNDPGPLFPSMHEMRQAVFGPADLDDIAWLNRYQPAQGLDDYEDEAEITLTTDPRRDPLKTEVMWKPEIFGESDPKCIEKLYKLGWPVTAKSDSYNIQKCVTYFQRSTLGWEKDHPERVLKVDGVAGPKTLETLDLRLKQTGLGD